MRKYKTKTVLSIFILLVMIGMNIWSTNSGKESSELSNDNIEATAFMTEFGFFSSNKHKGSDWVQGSSYSSATVNHWREMNCVEKGDVVRCSVGSVIFILGDIHKDCGKYRHPELCDCGYTERMKRYEQN